MYVKSRFRVVTRCIIVHSLPAPLVSLPTAAGEAGEVICGSLKPAQAQ